MFNKNNELRPLHTAVFYFAICLFLGEELSSKHFNQLYERINKLSIVKIKENNGNERIIWARFMKEYPVGNNDWGDFQTHRRLLGLITIGSITLYKNDSLIGIVIYASMYFCVQENVKPRSNSMKYVVYTNL
jgi:hypothetical protein